MLRCYRKAELLTEVVPGIARVGILGDANEGEWWVAAFKEYEAAARVLKIQLQSLEVRGQNPDLEGAFEAAAKGGATALIAIRGLFAYSKRIADLAIKHRLQTASKFPHSIGFRGRQRSLDCQRRLPRYLPCAPSSQLRNLSEINSTISVA